MNYRLKSVVKRFFSSYRPTYICYRESTGYELKYRHDICRICKGSGRVECITCNRQNKDKEDKDNTTENICSECESGLIMCQFCVDSGYCNYIFLLFCCFIFLYNLTL